MAIEITLPRLGWSMEEGVFQSWLKKEGDVVKTGDMLAEVETDKATVVYEAEADGTIEAAEIRDGDVGHAAADVGRPEVRPVHGPVRRRLRQRLVGIPGLQVRGVVAGRRSLRADGREAH